MMKLILAEDEAIERESLRYLISQQYADSIEIVYEAVTGKDAVEQAMKWKPEIMLLDIHMPEMDGLEAARMIRSFLPNTEILILTAYSYFEYAQKAISFEVRDYLLKPISNRNLFDAIDRSLASLHSKKALEERRHRLEDRFEYWRYLLEREFLLEALYPSAASGRQLEEYLQWLQTDSNIYSCIVIHFESYEDGLSSVADTVRTRLAFYAANMIGAVLGKKIILLLFDQHLVTSVASSSFQKVLEEIKVLIQLTTHSHFQIGWSKPYELLVDVSTAYNEATKAAEKADHQVIQPLHHDKEDSVYPFALEEHLCELIIREDLVSAELLIPKLFNYFSTRRPNLLQHDTRQLCAQIHRSLFQHFGAFEASLLDITAQQLGDLTATNEMSAVMRKILPELIEAVHRQRQSTRDELIQLIKAYLKEHIAYDLTLEHVSKKMGFSMFYLSKYFKKATGINFKEYVIQIRMEKAKNLLTSHHLTIQEVAIAVGYQDANYFSKAFKKYTGIPPTQFVSQLNKLF